MSSDDEDTRTLCKYGASCYQKNPAHHEKFKHPEKRRRSESPESSDISKKQKNDNETSPSKTKDSPEKQKKANETSPSKTKESPGKQKKVKDDKSNENQDKQKNVNDISSSSDDDWVNDVNLLELETLADRREFIKKHFLVEMPEDFYTFWEFCKELNKEKPKEAFKSVGLTLVGPYDVLDESFKTVNDSNSQKYFLHWRYYYDPPEFQTVIKGDDKTGYHIGYFRDSPEENPSFLGYNEANKNCIINQLGENIFGAINTYMEKVLRIADPFKKMSLTKLQKSVQNKARELKLNLNSHGKSRKTVCKSFHTAGIVVPYNRSTQLGYRPLLVDDKELKKLLNQVEKTYEEGGDKAFSSLQPVITAATIANDECDFGTALELGINMFCFGHKCFTTSILNLLKITYALLSRHAFAEIIEEHLKCRKKENPHIINF